MVEYNIGTVEGIKKLDARIMRHGLSCVKLLGSRNGLPSRFNGNETGMVKTAGHE